mmetsp:Transcript_22412/g.49106  ORF Transcript_22412/g.49106 Transcript_22412/m.49106 type:complete len:128 (-) Transcript_22412:470-853(-)
MQEQEQKQPTQMWHCRQTVCQGEPNSASELVCRYFRRLRGRNIDDTDKTATNATSVQRGLVAGKGSCITNTTQHDNTTQHITTTRHNKGICRMRRHPSTSYVSNQPEEGVERNLMTGKGGREDGTWG